nr:hypothetical protein [Tanacetum cinerariifolium]
MEECHKLLTDSVDDSILRHNVSKPLPLSGPPGQVTIQSDFFFNKDLEYLRYGSKGSRPALSISKMNAAYYPDVGLEKMVPDYAVRTHMWILSVVRIEVFSMYGYDYMKKIVLHRADLNEHVITERDFKHLVIQQRVEDFQLGIESYQTQLNLTKPQWDATGFEYKHDYTVIDSSRAVTFRDRYGVQMMMHFNEIHNVRTASAAVKPCQGDSSEFYLIIGSIYTDQRGIMVLATLFNESEQRHFRSFITNVNLQESRWLQLLAKEMSIHNSMLTLYTYIKDKMTAERPTTQLPLL